MTASVGFVLILGLLCFNECGGQGAFYCKDLPKYTIQRGLIIMTVNHRETGRTWCGQESGVFLAVAQNILFHLRCSEGAKKLDKAVAAISNMAELTPETQLIFQANDKCTSFLRVINTGSNALVLAEMLNGHTLNFDGKYCNAYHYIDYLSNGRVTSQTEDNCPVFRSFTKDTVIIASPKKNAFRLEGKVAYFDFPGSGKLHSGALVESPKKKTKSGPRSLPGSNSSSSLGHVVDKKGGFGGGRSPKIIPKYVPGHGGSNYRSSASRTGGLPFGGFKFPSFKSSSFSKFLPW